MSATSAYNQPPTSSNDYPSSSSPVSVTDSQSMIRSTSLDQPQQRPGLGSRQSSGTMIISRDAVAEAHESNVTYPATDVRCMSPKRTVEDVEKLGEEARSKLQKQAQLLQESLLAIVDRIETVKEEHEKLEGGNKFLQSYIGELIQTSKITSAKSRPKGRA